ncbi:MAG: hypothetical protein U1D30_23780 [Planctomycetota bacterium]
MAASSTPIMLAIDGGATTLIWARGWLQRNILEMIDQFRDDLFKASRLVGNVNVLRQREFGFAGFPKPRQVGLFWRQPDRSARRMEKTTYAS